MVFGGRESIDSRMRYASLLVQCENNEIIQRVAAVKNTSIDIYASDICRRERQTDKLSVYRVRALGTIVKNELHTPG